MLAVITGARALHKDLAIAKETPPKVVVKAEDPALAELLRQKEEELLYFCKAGHIQIVAHLDNTEVSCRRNVCSQEAPSTTLRRVHLREKSTIHLTTSELAGLRHRP